MSFADADDHEVLLSSSVTGTDLDVGAYRVAVVYAQALLAATDKQGNTDEVVAELDELVEQVLVKLPKVEEVMASGMIAPDQKQAIIDRVFRGKITPVFLHFLKVLVGHERGGNLRAIQRAVHDLLDEMRNRVRVQVTTAAPVDREITKRIASQLRTALSAEPMLDCRVDPDLIGGIVFRIGDTVYDGSVATQLEQVRSQMINRSVHEIQSRRDRFSNPAGN
ncbi:MAG TPA: ATP synthase F1 subunit delta [Pirellulales bacterium]|nr:ATP synthase F1 subunit delta [Pirellulales bacterium]